MLIDINVPCDEPQFIWHADSITDELIHDIEKKLVDAVEYAYDEAPQVYPVVSTGPIVAHLTKLRDEYPDIFARLSLERIASYVSERVLEGLKRSLED